VNALKWVPGDDDKIAADVRADVSSWFTYFVRLSKEAQVMFVEAVRNGDKRAKQGSKQNASSRLMQVLVTHDAFKKWALDNHYMF
jgi:hypothetical protein